MKALNYRSPVGDDRKPFADWLRALSKSSGAYVIRSKETHQVFYVGESHSGQLRKTICNHFHAWRDTPDRKHFTYSRHHVEVAVRLTPPPAAIGAQDNLIQRLDPRDNSQGFVEKPF